MSRVPMGKVLLRNVIRHTDAHNKIQEESEMWKLRDIELQDSSDRTSKHRWMTSSDLARSNMHCDRYLDDSEGSVRDRLGERRCPSERDEREARYWSRKLYEFEAKDPDRWGHSGFKELYPEEFHSDGETDCNKRSRKNVKEKMTRDRQKKSSKRKKNKKKKKKERTAESDSESDSSTADNVKRKQKRKSGKSKHSRKKHRSKAREEDGSTEDGDSGRRGDATPRKRRRTGTETQKEPERKKRKNWKTNDEKSEESSED